MCSARIEKDQPAFAVENSQCVGKLGCSRSEALLGGGNFCAARQLTLNNPANEEKDQARRRDDEQQPLEQVRDQIRQRLILNKGRERIRDQYPCAARARIRPRNAGGRALQVLEEGFKVHGNFWF